MTAALDMCEVVAQLIGKKCQYRPFVLVVPADIVLYVKLNVRSLDIDSLPQEKCLNLCASVTVRWMLDSLLQKTTTC